MGEPLRPTTAAGTRAPSSLRSTLPLSTTTTTTTSATIAATPGTSTSPTSPTTTTATTSPFKRAGSFLVLGDWGWDEEIHGEISSRACQQAVADAMAAKARELGDIKFVVNVGDSFYPGGVTNRSDPAWDSKWRNIYAQELRSVPWYSVYGNHDYHFDPCACTEDLQACAQINDDMTNLDYFYMPNTSYFVEHPELKLEVIALDMNYCTDWVKYTCHYSPCQAACMENLQRRMDSAFELFYRRAAESHAENLLIFSHYPTDYFEWAPKFLDELRQNSTHRINYFGGHRHNVDRRSTTSISPNDSWLSGGGGGWGCEQYGKEQGFVVGEIGVDAGVRTYAVTIDFDICCKRP